MSRAEPVGAVAPASLRRERMYALINEREFVPVSELSEAFRVSEVTVRTDLEELDSRGLVRRVRGGALRRTVRTSELPFEQTAVVAAAAKTAIGRAAATFVSAGDTVILDVGTTATAVARALVERIDLREVTVFTNGLNVAMELEPAIPRLHVLVTGGTLRPLQHSLVDPLGARMLEDVHADVAFIGCNGVDPQGGVTNVNLPEAEIKQRMLRAAHRRVVVADGSKLGRVALSRLCDVDDIDLLITDASAAPEVVSGLTDAGLQIQVAEVATGPEQRSRT